MSPRAVRLAAIPIALLAFGLRLAITFWWTPLTWRLTTPGRSIVLLFGGYVVGAVIPFSIYALVAWWAARPPADLRVRAGTFVAPSTATASATNAILLMFLAGGLIVTERVPNADAMRLAQLDFALPLSIIAAGVFTLLAAAILFMDRPRAILTPDALIVKGLWTRSVRWEELAPGGPNWPQPGRLRSLVLYRRQAPAAVPASVPVMRMHVDPAFLARAIRHYVEHAADRAGIGTDEGLRRLHELTSSATVR